MDDREYISGDKQEAQKAVEDIHDALLDVIEGEFGHCILITMVPGGEVDENSDGTSVVGHVKSIHFGGIDPAMTHLIAVKTLLDYGASSYDRDNISPELIGQLFGVSLPEAPRKNHNGDSGPKILMP